MRKWILGTLVVVVVVGAAAPAVLPRLGSAETVATPAARVQAFYDWYIDLPMEEIRDGYANTEFVTEGFIEKVETIRATFDGGGYDVVLQAQDIPTSVTVTAETVTGDRATVELSTSFEGHRLQVELVKVGGKWMIDDVSRAN